MVAIVLLIIAVVLFALAAAGVPAFGIALVPAGLACWAGSQLATHLRGK